MYNEKKERGYNMGDYFNKYRALDFIAQKFPQLEGKKM